MSAIEIGAKRASSYLQRNPVETLATMTLNQFCAIGRLDARQHFKQKKAQDDYVLGWFQIGRTVVTLFKPEETERYVADKEIMCIVAELKSVQERIEKLLQWRPDDMALTTHLNHTKSEIEDARCDMADVINYLLRSQEK